MNTKEISSNRQKESRRNVQLLGRIGGTSFFSGCPNETRLYQLRIVRATAWSGPDFRSADYEADRTTSPIEGKLKMFALKLVRLDDSLT